MAFDADFQHWPTISAFTAYLQGVPRPSWCTGLTNHNTYIPNETQWRGLESMKSMRLTYISKGWSAGPHLYLVAQAPDAADTGIWQMTPLSHVGVHAGACNAHHLGIENCGDFDARPPTADQYTLLLAVNRAILEHWGLPPTSVNVHNECMTGRTCPGKHLTGAQIRADLSAPWPRVPPVLPAPITKQYRVKHRYVTQRKEDSGPPIIRELVSGEIVTVDKWYANGRVHFASGEGFGDLQDLEPLP